MIGWGGQVRTAKIVPSFLAVTVGVYSFFLMATYDSTNRAHFFCAIDSSVIVALSDHCFGIFFGTVRPTETAWDAMVRAFIHE